MLLALLRLVKMGLWTKNGLIMKFKILWIAVSGVTYKDLGNEPFEDGLIRVWLWGTTVITRFFTTNDIHKPI